MSIKIKKRLIILLSLAAVFGSCEKVFDLPEAKEYLSDRVNYSNKIFTPIIGRTNLMRNGFNADNSTQPMTFEIVNARWGDGRPVTDIFEVRPTYVWIKEYDGKEKSLEEIEAKRKLEDHPLLEFRSSGELIMWPSATNELISPRPADSTTFPQDIRYFDVKITNSGGQAVLKDFQLIPWRERPYEPSNDMNLFTGDPAPHPRSQYKHDYIRPYINNVVGKETNKYLESNDEKDDVVVYIRPFEGGNGHSLRFKVLDKDSAAINPERFNETKWDQLVHGFNMQKTDEYVQYDVAYPIPLVNIPTFYAPGGSRARSMISYSRLGFNGFRTVSTFGLDFAIYKPGDWEIVFHFKNDNPKFEDE